jgi:hypothetical protein
MMQPEINKQRVYDAMLIKGFRKDVNMGMLNYWLRPYNLSIPDPELKRQPPPYNIRIRLFVGEYLKPLADRLWDTEPAQDIKTLDWMAGLDSHRYRKVDRELNKVRRQIAIDDGRTGLLAQNIARKRESNQWHITKARGGTRRSK